MDGYSVDLNQKNENIDNTLYQLRNICLRNRQVGSKTFILKSAIINPDCFIVSLNLALVCDMRDIYHKMINEDPVLNEIYLSNGRREPKFVTLNQMEQMVGYERLPIIFDSSCFF